MTDYTQKRRTQYLEKKYLGDDAVVKAPIALPPLSTLPYALRSQIWERVNAPYYLINIQGELGVMKCDKFTLFNDPCEASIVEAYKNYGIHNFEWRNTRKKWRPEWKMEKYINSLYAQSRSSIIGIPPTPHHYAYTHKWSARYTTKDLKKIIDNMPQQKKPYKSNTKKADLWKIIMKYD
jgi:hypothetical protein